MNKKENFSKIASKIESSGYEPVNCLVSSGKRVAIIVPFRDDGSKGNRRSLGPKDKNQIKCEFEILSNPRTFQSPEAAFTAYDPDSYTTKY